MIPRRPFIESGHKDPGKIRVREDKVKKVSWHTLGLPGTYSHPPSSSNLTLFIKTDDPSTSLTIHRLKKEKHINFPSVVHYSFPLTFLLLSKVLNKNLSRANFQNKPTFLVYRWVRSYILSRKNIPVSTWLDIRLVLETSIFWIFHIERLRSYILTSEMYMEERWELMEYWNQRCTEKKPREEGGEV